MTNQEILDLIDGDEQASTLAAAGNDNAVAARLSEIAPQVSVSTFVTYRTLAAKIGVVATRRLITTINAVAQSDVLVMEFQRFLRDTVGVDISDPQILSEAEPPYAGMLKQFVALGIPDGLTEEDATAIRNLTLKNQVFSADMVSNALRSRRDGE